jgi:hypothetical protein
MRRMVYPRLKERQSTEPRCAMRRMLEVEEEFHLVELGSTTATSRNCSAASSMAPGRHAPTLI